MSIKLWVLGLMAWYLLKIRLCLPLDVKIMTLSTFVSRLRSNKNTPVHKTSWSEQLAEAVPCGKFQTFGLYYFWRGWWYWTWYKRGLWVNLDNIFHLSCILDKINYNTCISFIFVEVYLNGWTKIIKREKKHMKISVAQCNKENPSFNNPVANFI